MMRLKFNSLVILKVFICFIVLIVTIIIFLTFVNDLVPFSLNLQSESKIPTSFSTIVPLLDLWDFRYLLNSNACAKSNEAILSVLIVTSYAGNVDTRRAIRTAYPSSELRQLGIIRVFLLAAANPRNALQDEAISQSDLILESERFSDLVQGNFHEAYRNLTYKHVMGLQWAVAYCKHARFIIKMDDDIVVDFYQLSDLIKSITPTDRTGLLMGYVLHGLKPMREKTNKWFVTRAEFSKSFYPPFLSGWLYVTTPRVAQVLLAIAQLERFFWIDDTFVTGILARRAHIKHRNISEKFAVHPELLECCIDDEQDKRLMCDFVAGPDGGNNGLMQRLKNHAANCHLHKCVKRTAEKYLDKTCVTKEKIVNLGRGKANVMPYRLS